MERKGRSIPEKVTKGIKKAEEYIVPIALYSVITFELILASCSNRTNEVNVENDNLNTEVSEITPTDAVDSAQMKLWNSMSAEQRSIQLEFGMYPQGLNVNQEIVNEVCESFVNSRLPAKLPIDTMKEKIIFLGQEDYLTQVKEVVGQMDEKQIELFKNSREFIINYRNPDRTKVKILINEALCPESTQGLGSNLNLRQRDPGIVHKENIAWNMVLRLNRSCENVSFTDGSYNIIGVQNLDLIMQNQDGKTQSLFPGPSIALTELLQKSILDEKGIYVPTNSFYDLAADAMGKMCVAAGISLEDIKDAYFGKGINNFLIKLGSINKGDPKLPAKERGARLYYLAGSLIDPANQAVTSAQIKNMTSISIGKAELH